MGDLAMNPSALASPISQQSQGASTTAASVSETKPKKKICCACPDTKKLRDECIVEHGEAACSKWIDAHLKCLRAEGFNVYYPLAHVCLKNSAKVLQWRCLSIHEFKS